jgi:signal transduction histidine kinase
VRERDAFLSVAAHELKTPLTALVGQVQLLQRRTQRAGCLNERDQHALQVVRAQADRLTTMVNELLDLSRMESGQLDVVRAPLHLDELVQQVVDELQPTLQRHQIVFTASAQGVAISGDAARLAQVLRNLLGNAVKYSPDGGPIALSLTTEADAVVIAIRDQGIGIPPEALPLLFERFYRAPNATARHIDGVGVGLFVVKEIVARHGGTIAVTSSVGQGSTFTLRLPLNAQAQAT